MGKKMTRMAIIALTLTAIMSCGRYYSAEIAGYVKTEPMTPAS